MHAYSIYCARKVRADHAAVRRENGQPRTLEGMNLGSQSVLSMQLTLLTIITEENHKWVREQAVRSSGCHTRTDLGIDGRFGTIESQFHKALQQVHDRLGMIFDHPQPKGFPNAALSREPCPSCLLKILRREEDAV